MEEGKDSCWRDGRCEPLSWDSTWCVCGITQKPWSWSGTNKKGSWASSQRDKGGPRALGLSVIIPSFHPAVLATQQLGELSKIQTNIVTSLLKPLQGLPQAPGPKPQLLPVPLQGLCTLSLLPSPVFCLLLSHCSDPYTGHLPSGLVFASILHTPCLPAP